MQSTDIPQRLQQAFASTAGQRNAIPVTTSTPGEASLVQGFPPETMQPVSAGGVPPDGKDMNGILFLATGASSWSGAGGLYPYDATYSGLIGGYPKGAVLLMADLSGLWLSTAENNTTSPEAGGTGWVPLIGTGITTKTLAASNVTLTPQEASRPILFLNGAITANVQVNYPTGAPLQRLVVNSTTGAFSVTVKTTAGTGPVVDQGATVPVWADGTGTNMFLALPSASETVRGISSIATQATVNTGTNDNELVTPLKMATYVAAVLPDPSLSPRALIYFDSTGTEIFRIDPDGVIGTVSKPSTGTYEITAASAFPANYMAFAFSGAMVTQSTKNTAQISVQTRDPTNGTVIDAGPTQVSIFF